MLKKDIWYSPTQYKCKDTYLPFKASDFIELIKVLQTAAEQTENVTMQLNAEGFKLKKCVGQAVT